MAVDLWLPGVPVLLIVIRIISIQWAGWHGRDSAVTSTVKMIPTTVSGILL